MLNGLEIYEREKFPPDASRLVREPLDWEAVLERIPRLVKPSVELMIIHRGRQYPFTDSRAPRWGRSMPKVLFGEGTGKSRAYKSLASRSVRRRFNELDIGVELIRERPDGLIADYDPQHYNYVLALGTAMRMTDRRQAYQRGGYYQHMPNFVFLDRGPVSTNLFNAIYKKYGAGDPLVQQLTARHMGELDIIWSFYITTDTAIRRGSRMTRQMHDEVGAIHGRLPDIVAAQTSEKGRPIVIAQIDANGQLADVKQLLAGTIGTIVEGMRYG